jgi:hypothetical protein
MKLICVFHANRLLERSTEVHPSFATQFKQNVSHQYGFDVDALTCVMFTHSELKEYLTPKRKLNNKKVIIEKERLLIIEPIKVAKKGMSAVNWRNIQESDYAKYFNEETIVKIKKNLDYYNSLSNDKFKVDFKFEWPELIEDVEQEITTFDIQDKVILEILPVILD